MELLAFAARGSMAATGGNLPASELAPYITPLRVGDPLGLGLVDRPSPPPDPDAYSRAREDEEFSRSLLSAEARAALNADIEKDGFLTIAQVRAIVAENTVKSSIDTGGLDSEIMALIDARTNYKIFVAGDNIYTREDLYNHYPFHEFGVQPEAIFVQQELGVFPARRHALSPEDLEYVARDAGDESVEFVMVEDLVGASSGRNHGAKIRTPTRIVKTKIFLGKERWDDFATLQRFYRGAIRVAAAQSAAGLPGLPGLSMLGLMAGSPPARVAARTLPCALRSVELFAQEDSAQQVHAREEALYAREDSAQQVHAREEALYAREEALRAREEALRAREDEQHRAITEAQQRLDLSITRFESMILSGSELAQPAISVSDIGDRVL